MQHLTRVIKILWPGSLDLTKITNQSSLNYCSWTQDYWSSREGVALAVTGTKEADNRDASNRGTMSKYK